MSETVKPRLSNPVDQKRGGAWYPGAPYDPNRPRKLNPRPLLVIAWVIQGYLAACWIFGWVIFPAVALIGIAVALSAGQIGREKAVIDYVAHQSPRETDAGGTKA
jgi:hypothetical protein